jgi:hypothetical protein
MGTKKTMAKESAKVPGSSRIDTYTGIFLIDAGRIQPFSHPTAQLAFGRRPRSKTEARRARAASKSVQNHNGTLRWATPLM